MFIKNRFFMFVISLILGLAIMIQINNDARNYTFANVHTVNRISNQLETTKEDVEDL